MREIKFRAFDGEDDEIKIMIYSDGRNREEYQASYDFTIDEEGKIICMWQEDYDDSFGYSVTRDGVLDNIMQYTGFKGCEDIEIYENDIVEFSVFDRQGSDTQFTGVIKFSEGAWQIWHDNENEYYGCDGAFSLDWVIYQDDTIEVIGNVWENPELLEAAK